MKTALARGETQVPEEDRITRIEITVDEMRKDVAEIKDDVKTLNVRLNDSIAANAREFGTLRAELADHRATLRAELADHRATFRAELADHSATFRTELADHRATFGAALADHKADTEKGFGSLHTELAGHKTENEKRFGALLVAIESNKTETERNFGNVRVEIEKVRTTIESTKLWLILNTLGIVGTLLAAITTYLHAVKVI